MYAVNAEKEKRERFHFPDLFNKFFSLHLEFVNCIMCERFFVRLVYQPSIHILGTFIFIIIYVFTLNNLDYHAYKVG